MKAHNHSSLQCMRAYDLQKVHTYEYHCYSFGVWGKAPASWETFEHL